MRKMLLLVGTGFVAGWSAKILAEYGLKTALVRTGERMAQDCPVCPPP
jgi:hypothetical protein